jgi:hypothetical protein
LRHSFSQAPPQTPLGEISGCPLAWLNICFTVNGQKLNSGYFTDLQVVAAAAARYRKCRAPTSHADPAGGLPP